MFKKLISDLSFNPSLIEQLTFYGRRLKQESSIRRTGFVFIALALVVQVFAVISPPKQSSASPNNNDLIPGGISSAQQATADCQNNLDYYALILAYYGISCGDVAQASTITLHSTDYNRQLYSMGHLAYGLPGETPVNIYGATLYWRYLWGWDTGAYSTYTALQLHSDNGTTFFILFNCGNLVSIGLPSPPPTPAPTPAKPQLTASKTTTPGFPSNGSEVPPGTTLGFRIYYNNVGAGAAHSVDVTDALPANTSFVQMGGGGDSVVFHSTPAPPFVGQPASEYGEWINNTMPAGAKNWYNDFYVKINNGVPNNTQICNVAIVRSIEFAPITTNRVCITVEQMAPKPPKPPPPPPPPTPKPCVTNCLSFSKTASNVTQNIANANGTTAQAGDVIKYTLKVKNKEKATIKNFVVQENLSDVLVYADLQNPNGGSLSKNNVLSWHAVNIKPGRTIEKQFTVQIKNPIPQNAPNQADPQQYDMIMTNVYGNAVNIKLPLSPTQVTVQTVQTLPNTGPGSGLLIGFGVTLVIGYFFARSRLLYKEVGIVREDFNSQGGSV